MHQSLGTVRTPQSRPSTFLIVKMNALRWLADFLKSKNRPAVVVRNEYLVEAHDAFGKLVKQGAYSYGGFFDFLREENKRVQQQCDFL